MTTALPFDAATSRKVESAYLTPDVAAQRGHVLKALQLRPGEKVLDIGVGPGLLALDMAMTVGEKGEMRGVDLSEGMLALARQRCGHLPWAEFAQADALKLPYSDACFDAAVSTQVYEYVADIESALAELYRITRPGGRVVILDTDYDSFVLRVSDQALSNRILKAWDAHFVHRGLPRVLTGLLRAAGFTVRHRDAFPMFNTEFHDNTFAKPILTMMASFAVGREGVTKEEAVAWLADLADLGARGEFFFSLNRYLFVAGKP